MPKALFDLSGRVALVTGGSKGLGKAMARGFAEAGADVVMASRSEDELKKIDAGVRATINEAAEFATHDPEPDPAELYTDVYR